MYDKKKLLSDLKSAHAEFVTALENELYVQYAEKPSYMTQKAYENYKESLNSRLENARSVLNQVMALEPKAFTKSDPAGLTAIITVKYSNPRMDSATMMVVYETKLPAALLEKYGFPMELCWGDFPGHKVGEKIPMKSEGRDETYDYYAEITAIE